MIYEVRTLDVWGNEEDGFEVNDWRKVGQIEVADMATDEEILDALIGREYLSTRCVDVDDVGDGMIDIVLPSGRPLLHLVA